jgi:hypothetical protein
MSPFKINLNIQSIDPSAEIFVIDSHFNKVADGVGILNKTFEPGLYSIKYKSGSSMSEKHVKMTSENSNINFEISENKGEVSFNKLNDLRSQDFFLEPSVVNAGQNTLSDLHKKDSNGTGYLYVFNRNKNLEIFLSDTAGKKLRDINFDSDNENIESGYYFLNIKWDKNPVMQTALFIPEGWQLNILVEEWKECSTIDDLIFSITEYTENINDILKRFNYSKTALLGLKEGKALIPKNDLEFFLYSKFQNPFLGILWSHIYIQRGIENQDLFKRVVSRLKEIIPNHPDVICLEILLAIENKEQIKVQNLLKGMQIPFLRSSWNILVKASFENSDIIPFNSTLAIIAEKLKLSSLFLFWELPLRTTEDIRTIKAVKSSIEPESDSIFELLKLIYKNTDTPIPENELNQIERAIFTYYKNIPIQILFDILNNSLKTGKIKNVNNILEKLLKDKEFISRLINSIYNLIKNRRPDSNLSRLINIINKFVTINQFEPAQMIISQLAGKEAGIGMLAKNLNIPPAVAQANFLSLKKHLEASSVMKIGGTLL